jgi:hypothetical protein
MSIRKPWQLRQVCLWSGLTILTALCAGCDSLLGAHSAFADEARVLITGDTPVPMKIIVSTQFTAVRGLDGNLVPTILQADTISAVTLPHDRRHVIKGRDRFLVRVMNSDAESTATIQMRVFLDQNEIFNQRATMKDSYLESISYYGGAQFQMRQEKQQVVR